MFPRLKARYKFKHTGTGGGPPSPQDPTFPPKPRVQAPLGEVAAHGLAVVLGGHAKECGRRRIPEG